MRKLTLLTIIFLAFLVQCAEADKMQFDASKGLGSVLQVAATEVVNAPVSSQQSSGAGGSAGTSTNPTFTFGGNVSGLVSGSLTLTNGSDTVTILSSSPGISGGAGAYQFSSSLNGGASYNVSITGFPNDLSCNLYNNIGTVSANVVDIDVYCYSVIITSTLTVVEGTTNASTNFTLKLSHPPAANPSSTVTVAYPNFPSNLSLNAAFPTLLGTTTVNRIVSGTNETGTPDFTDESEVITARVSQSIGSATNVSTTSSVTISDNDKRMYMVNAGNGGTGNLGGKSGADTLCTNNKPGGLSGTVIALLGTTTRKPLPTPTSDWPLKPLHTYYRTDNTTIIASSNSASILPISWTNKVSANAGVTSSFACPMGSTACGYATGFDNTWALLSSQNCSNWTSSSSLAEGMTGWAGSVNSAAIDYFASSCDSLGSSANVLCVEQ
ncbi:DUF1554 domain-containing protein [Leptospira sp. 201903071]|uniref:DUF1554 domain-containing protein n=1 Tax=Leptospira ainazelensis TaxID=2810034 RepID=UPI001963B00C|nr:DUF1554 domain-containing protein [Leptospira ainazelensis]MBM9499924.1 DUF1554 domain-containing protein [Leptospira ainazelensis]